MGVNESIEGWRAGELVKEHCLDVKHLTNVAMDSLCTLNLHWTGVQLTKPTYSKMAIALIDLFLVFNEAFTPVRFSRTLINLARKFGFFGET